MNYFLCSPKTFSEKPRYALIFKADYPQQPDVVVTNMELVPDMWCDNRNLYAMYDGQYLGAIPLETKNE